MRLPRGRAVASVVSVEESLYDEDLGEVSGRSTHLQVAPGSVVYDRDATNQSRDIESENNTRPCCAMNPTWNERILGASLAACLCISCWRRSPTTSCSTPNSFRS